MKKIVLKVEFYEDRIKQKAMKVASGILGVESVGVEVEDKKMTIVGEIDAVKAVKKLRKLCRTDIVSVAENKQEKKDAEANDIQDPETAFQVPYYDLHGLYSYPHNYCHAPPPYQICYYYHN